MSTRFLIDGPSLDGAAGPSYPAPVEHIVDVIIGTQQQQSQDVWDGLLKDIQAVYTVVIDSSNKSCM